MYESIRELLRVPGVLAGVIAVGSVVVAYVVQVVIARALLHLVSKTRTEVDDAIVQIIRKPIVLTVIIVGIALATHVLARPPAEAGVWFLPAMAKAVAYGLLKTFAVIIWTFAAIRVGKVVLHALAGRGGDDVGMVQKRTLPAFDILAKVVAIALGTYLALLAWGVNVTGWLASAGILGLVVGLAAKDTLANLFAGVFILADAPYKLGDYIILDGELRGRVTEIGIRSTRILTRSDIEITVPNAVIGNTKIVNETAGPHEMERVRVRVEVAYGSDVDQVREVLLECPVGAQHVAEEPEPRVRFRSFEGSGLRFELLAWIDEPYLRGRVIDDLNARVYKALGAAGIEIPYAKRDVYIKEMPS